MASADTVLEGYLMKKKKFLVKIWLEYYFLLQNCGDLMYYKSHSKLRKTIGCIKLRSVNSVIISPRRQDGCELRLLGKHAQKKRPVTHLLLACNRSDALTWSKNIDEVRQKVMEYDQSAGPHDITFKQVMDENSILSSIRFSVWKKSTDSAELVSLLEKDQNLENEFVQCQCYSPSGSSNICLPVQGRDLINEVRSNLQSWLAATDGKTANASDSDFSLRIGIMDKYAHIPNDPENNMRMCDYKLFKSCLEERKMLVVQLLCKTVSRDSNQTDALPREEGPMQDQWGNLGVDLKESDNDLPELLEKPYSPVKDMKTLCLQRTFLHVRIKECSFKAHTLNSEDDGIMYGHVVASLYHGAEKLGESYECATSSIPYDQNLKWNELLTFSIAQIDLPQILSINFAVYCSSESETEGTFISKLAGWSNFHLKGGQLSHVEVGNGNFITEKECCLYLWSHHPTYSCGTVPECTSTDSCGMLNVKVEFQNNENPNEEHDSSSRVANEEFPISPSSKDAQTLTTIVDNNDIITPLNEYERNLVWQFRDFLAQFPHAMTKFFQGVKWDERDSRFEVYGLLQRWQPMTSFHALELLGPQIADRKVRAFAVQYVELLSNKELVMILPQLVQTLEFEPTLEDSALLEVLIRRACSNWSIAQKLFWHIKVGMQTPLYSSRFQIIFETFLISCSPKFRKHFSKQEDIVSKLLDIAKVIKTEAANGPCQDILQDLVSKIQFPKPILLPIDPRYMVNGIAAKKCKYMTSKKLPLWLVFQKAKQPAKKFLTTIFKCGDDLRQDMLTLQILDVMEKIWWKSGLDLKLTVYKCVPTGVDDGMLEVVGESQTLSNIAKMAGGGAKCFEEDFLANWLREQNNTEEKYNSAVDNFIRSCAGYCVASCVIGIGDRHNDNIMIKKTGELFHIDFGHILGNFKSKFGIRRERAEFVFTPDFAFVMGGVEDRRFKNFEYTCAKAFNKLRENGRLFLTLMNLMVSAGLPQLQSPDKILYMRDRLLLNQSDAFASEHFVKLIHDSLHTKTTQINNAIHTWKHS